MVLFFGFLGFYFFFISLKDQINLEKLLLYISLGVLLSIIYILSILAIKQCLQRRNLLRKIETLHEFEEAHDFDNAVVPNRILSQKAAQAAAHDTNNTSLIIDQNLNNYEIEKQLMNANNYHTLNYNKNSNNNLHHHNSNNINSHTLRASNQFQDMHNELENFENFKLITRNGSTKIVNGTNDDISEYEIPIIRYNDRVMQQYSHY